jgi:hypothetical protein
MPLDILNTGIKVVYGLCPYCGVVDRQNVVLLLDQNASDYSQEHTALCGKHLAEIAEQLKEETNA